AGLRSRHRRRGRRPPFGPLPNPTPTVAAAFPAQFMGLRVDQHRSSFGTSCSAAVVAVMFAAVLVGALPACSDARRVAANPPNRLVAHSLHKGMNEQEVSALSRSRVPDRIVIKTCPHRPRSASGPY